MRKAHHRITCPLTPRRWTWGLALCALLACTLSIPDLASGAEGTPGPATINTVEAETNAANEALPVGEDATAATTPTTEPTPATDPVADDPASGEPTADDPAAGGPTTVDGTTGDAGGPATQVSQDGVGTSPNGPSPTVSNGRLLVTLPWGGGPGEVGLVRGAEGLSRGPEALAIAPDGRTVVLDSVNRRLVVLSPEGLYLATLELRLSEPRFLAVDSQAIYVLDCDADHQLVCLDWSGAEWARFGLPPLDEVVTALLMTESGPCLETGHDQVFLLNLKSNLSKSIVSGKSVLTSLQSLGGRPLDKAPQRVAKLTFGRTVGLRIKSFKLDRKTLRPTLIATVDARLAAAQALEHLVSADPLASGELVIGARLVQKKGSSEDQAALILGRFRVTEEGRPEREAGSFLFLDDRSIAYVGPPYVVASDGRVLQPKATAEGYSILVHEFPTASQGLTNDATVEEVTP